MPVKPEKNKPKTTTIQVKSGLKDELDLLKIVGGFSDLNSLINDMKENYLSNKKLSLDPKIEKLLKKIKK